jgi:glycosyltransferase involved in cell wall biosynthesis
VATVDIIVPCYNEAVRLDDAAFVSFSESNPGVVLHLVDDGSRDATADRIATLAASCPGRITATTLPHNQGKAGAVRAGLCAAIAAGARRVGYWDADLATPLGAIPQLDAVLDENPGVEIVLGSRVQLLGRRIARDPLRHYGGRVFATAASLVLRMPVYDTQCGAKIFRVTPLLEAALREPFETGWTFDVELLARLADLRIEGGLSPLEDVVWEFPLDRWVDVDGSAVRAVDFPIALGHLLRIWRSRRT